MKQLQYIFSLYLEKLFLPLMNQLETEMGVDLAYRMPSPCLNLNKGEWGSCLAPTHASYLGW